MSRSRANTTSSTGSGSAPDPREPVDQNSGQPSGEPTGQQPGQRGDRSGARTDAGAPPVSVTRPDVLFALFAEITSLPGVGPRNAPLFEKLAGGRVRDLVLMAPTGVVDRRRRDSVLGAAEGAVTTVEVTITAHHPPKGLPTKGRGRPYKIAVDDAETTFQLVFFHSQPDYLERILPVGERRVISGKIEIFDGVVQMVHPDHVVTPDAAEDEIPASEPVYPLTAGLTLRVLSKVMRAAVATAPETPEWLDPAFVAREGWPTWSEAIQKLHAPAGRSELEPTAPTRRRLAYDEMLAFQLALGLARARAVKGRGRKTEGDGRLRGRLRDGLAFDLTGAQKRAIAEITADMASPDAMMRLLQGDVGAGKTLVAFMAMLAAVEAGGQAALMAPTEILARQHASGLVKFADLVGVRVALATGRDGAKARRETLAQIAEGAADVIVGTHALFQRDVVFKDLRFVAIDEQHRFGVQQRLMLAEKGQGPEGAAADVLMMTATPIPRTLALTQCGDMDVSVLDEKPPGRQPIETRLFSLDKLEDVVAAVGRAMSKGARAYWVCPLVEDSELTDVAAAEARARALRAVYGAETVALAHGRLTPAEKDAAMARFSAGQARLLVATTVIEVGVDVPEATVMVIEHAERFGLAQLHQLRGRVGRGDKASHCLLLYETPLGKTARARLQALRESQDGFFLAEEDLRLRGSGDLLGVKQAGLPQFTIADVERQGDLMKIAQDDARLIIAQDPALAGDRGQALRVLLSLYERDEAMALLGVG